MITLIECNLKMTTKKKCNKCITFITKRHNICNYCKKYLECKKDKCLNCKEYFKDLYSNQKCLINDD